MSADYRLRNILDTTAFNRGRRSCAATDVLPRRSHASPRLRSSASSSRAQTRPPHRGAPLLVTAARSDI